MVPSTAKAGTATVPTMAAAVQEVLNGEVLDAVSVMAVPVAYPHSYSAQFNAWAAGPPQNSAATG